MADKGKKSHKSFLLNLKGVFMLKKVIAFLLVMGFFTGAVLYVNALMPKKSKGGKKVLVVYYSRTGNTERVAKSIAERLNGDTEKIVDKKDRSGFWGFIGGARDALKDRTTEVGEFKYDPSKYDLIIIGTPIWAGDMAPAVRTYILSQKDKLQGKKVAYFTTSGGSKPDKTVKSMEETSGVKGIAFTGIYEKDLKKEDVTQEKIDSFLKELKK